MNDLWTYKDTSWMSDGDLVGYDVEASDGSIGKIDEVTNEAGAASIVVDTGPWIFGKKRLIPAGAVMAVNHESETVTIGMTKDQIKSAPDYEASAWDEDSRTRHSDYYGRHSL